jgi:hypothetical protein
MTFAADETGLQTSKPIELYTFATPAVTYRHVANRRSSYSFGGNTYTPLDIDREEIITTPVPNDIPEVLVTMPASAQFVKDNAFGLQPRTMTVTITRVQQISGVGLQWWSGVVAAITVEGRWAKIRSPSSLDDPFKTSLSRVVCATLCNHSLYDARCTIARAGFTVNTTVNGAPVGRTLVVAAIGGNPDQWAKNGEVVHTASGERRAIKSQVGTTLQLSYAFRSIANLDAVSVYAGCDHTVKTCRDKFANVSNFGGHPRIPIANPFKTGVKGSPDL